MKARILLLSAVILLASCVTSVALDEMCPVDKPYRTVRLIDFYECGPINHKVYVFKDGKIAPCESRLVAFCKAEPN